MTRLIHTGAVIVDLVLEVPHMPDCSGDVLASSSEFVVGGGLNVLTAAQRDRLEVLFAGRTGTGMFGAMIAKTLDKHGIASALPPIADVDSGHCVVLVDPTAERTFVTSSGAEQLLSFRDLASVVVRDDDFVYVTGYSLSSAHRGRPLARWLPTLPMQSVVMFDPGPLVGSLDPELLGLVMSRTNVLTCNAREARIATGVEDPAEAARTLLAELRPGSTVLVRDGARGTWIADGSQSVPRRQHAPRVDPIDTNGAGDAHTGVLAAGLARQLAMDDAVLRANVAAALAVTRRGPATSPWTDEIDAAVADFRRSPCRVHGL